MTVPTVNVTIDWCGFTCLYFRWQFLCWSDEQWWVGGVERFSRFGNNVVVSVLRYVLALKYYEVFSVLLGPIIF